MTFDPSQHPRASSGQFSEKTGSAPEVRVNGFEPSPLSAEDKSDYSRGGYANMSLVHVLAERLGGEPVVMSQEGSSGWNHIALRTPDGRVLDVNGISNGSHVSENSAYTDEDDDGYYASFEVALRPVGAEGRNRIARSFAHNVEYQAGAERVADELISWYKS